MSLSFKFSAAIVAVIVVATPAVAGTAAAFVPASTKRSTSAPATPTLYQQSPRAAWSASPNDKDYISKENLRRIRIDSSTEENSRPNNLVPLNPSLPLPSSPATSSSSFDNEFSPEVLDNIRITQQQPGGETLVQRPGQGDGTYGTEPFPPVQSYKVDEQGVIKTKEESKSVWSSSWHTISHNGDEIAKDITKGIRIAEEKPRKQTWVNQLGTEALDNDAAAEAAREQYMENRKNMGKSVWTSSWSYSTSTPADDIQPDVMNKIRVQPPPAPRQTWVRQLGNVPTGAADEPENKPLIPTKPTDSVTWQAASPDQYDEYIGKNVENEIRIASKIIKGTLSDLTTEAKPASADALDSKMSAAVKEARMKSRQLEEAAKTAAEAAKAAQEAAQKAMEAARGAQQKYEELQKSEQEAMHLVEEARKAEEEVQKAEQARLEEARREAARLAEEEAARLAQQQYEEKKRAEQEAARLAEEARKAEEERKAEQARLEEARREAARLAEEEAARLAQQQYEEKKRAMQEAMRLVEEAKKAEEERKAEEARREAARLAEEEAARLAQQQYEEKKRAEQEAMRLAEEARKADEERKAEQARLEETRKEAARLAEEEAVRLAQQQDEEKKRVEQEAMRLAEEARKAEEERKTGQAAQSEESREKAEKIKKVDTALKEAARLQTEVRAMKEAAAQREAILAEIAREEAEIEKEAEAALLRQKAKLEEIKKKRDALLKGKSMNEAMDADIISKRVDDRKGLAELAKKKSEENRKE